jgi:hypothetical protein
MASYKGIIAKVAARAADPDLRIDMERAPPLEPLSDPEFLTKIERDLGFRLPTLLKHLYLTIADGGFGPGLGLFGARRADWMSSDSYTLADVYHINHKGDWPDKLLPICDWGCSVFSCIDCSSRRYQMIMMHNDWFDDETGKEGRAFLPEGIGFRDWIAAWADGVDLCERFRKREREHAIQPIPTPSQGLRCAGRLILPRQRRQP